MLQIQLSIAADAENVTRQLADHREDLRRAAETGALGCKVAAIGSVRQRALARQTSSASYGPDIQQDEQPHCEPNREVVPRRKV